MDGSVSTASIKPETYETFGCKLNAITPTQLFAKYGEAGFLYEEKRKKLVPYWSRIEENWNHAMKLGEELLYFLTYDGPQDGVWASVCSWRTTMHGWNSQHVVSIGSPVGSRNVLLGCAALRSQERYSTSDRFQQNWFRPTNRFAHRVFGSIVGTLGDDSAWVQAHAYFAITPAWLGTLRGPSVVWATHGDDDWRQFLKHLRGPVFIACDELDDPDLELEALDDLYRRVGLRRYRRIAVARSDAGDVCGVAIAYRGPLGLNFSFLENRCDLVVVPTLDGHTTAAVALALLRHLVPLYADFEPAFIPVVSDASVESALEPYGARPIRVYAQSMWARGALNRPGIPGDYMHWYEHVKRFYERLQKHDRWHGVGKAAGTAT